MTLDQIGQLNELHAETDIRFVGTVQTHSVVPGHAGKRIGKVNILNILEYMLYESFEHPDDILLLHKAHLAVYLSELGLAVSTQVLVAEALGYLKVTVETADHKQLLEQLRTLGQSIELARIHA